MTMETQPCEDVSPSQKMVSLHCQLTPPKINMEPENDGLESSDF